MLNNSPDMLPEILSVIGEDGTVTYVPLTPVTTFKDVAACVRDPGDPLPLLIETSPIGVRVVAGWERPLELLRLWNGLKDQVSYQASYDFQEDAGNNFSSVSETYVQRKEDDDNYPIDPWELYDLTEELKSYSSKFKFSEKKTYNTHRRESIPQFRTHHPRKNPYMAQKNPYMSYTNSTVPDHPNFLEEKFIERNDSLDSDDHILSSDGEANSSYNSHTASPRNLFVRSIVGSRRNRLSKRVIKSNMKKSNSSANDSKIEESRSFIRGNKVTSSLPSPRRNNVPEDYIKQFKWEEENGVPHKKGVHFKITDDESESSDNSKDNIRVPDFYRSIANSSKTYKGQLTPMVSRKKESPNYKYKSSNIGAESLVTLGADQFQNSSSIHNQRDIRQLLQEHFTKRSPQPMAYNIKDIHGISSRSPKILTNGILQSQKQFHTVLADQTGYRNNIRSQISPSSKKYIDQSYSNSIDYKDIKLKKKYIDDRYRYNKKVQIDQDNYVHTNSRYMQNEMKLLNNSSKRVPDSVTFGNIPTVQQQSRSGHTYISESPKQEVSSSRRRSKSGDPRSEEAGEKPVGPGARLSRKSNGHQVVHRRSYSDPLYEYLQNGKAGHGFREDNPRRRRHSGGSAVGGDEGMRDTHAPLTELPDGCELTVGELHDMASHQQQQIETQQQLLVAREQRLKYLKQQDTRTHQVHQEAERLRRLRERVDAQEAKLRRLRALRGQVEATRMNTASLTTDLDAMRHLFSEKEKELVTAVGKVEELTHQLEDLRQGRSAVNPNNQHHNELDKLRRELLYRNSVNREASARVSNQRETLATRRDEITKIDKRIAELQQRLHRKRLLNTQLASQITAATQAKQAQLKAVQQKATRDGSNREHSIDDSHVQHLKIPSGEELGEFGPNKHDPKYQTLPYNTKFLMGPNQSREQSWDSEGSMPSEYPAGSEQGYPDCEANMGSTEEMANSNNVNGVNSTVVRTVHSIPTSIASRGLAHAPQPHQINAATAQPGNPAMNPRVYGSTTSQINARSQPLGGSSQGINQDSSSVLPPTSLSLSFIQKLNPGVASQAQSRILLASSHLAQGVENVRAMDGSGDLVSADDSGIDVRNRPALPPKPAVPSKPLTPPRQKGDPLLSSTESLNTLQQTPPHNKNMGPGYRYANKQEVTEDNNWPSNANNNNNGISKREGEGEKVHVSINRRIEMPPDFMFPEDETPPSDLLGQRVQEIENNNGESRTENGLDSVDNLHASSVPYSELEKLRIDVSKEDKSNQDEYYSKNVSYNTPAIDESRQPDGADTPAALQEGLADGEAHNVNNNYVNNNSTSNINTQVVRRIKKGNLKTKNSNSVKRRVSFDPLALLLDASLEGELELVRRTAMEVSNPSAANDEGITALHNAICAGHLDIVTFLVTFGCDVNAQDSDGWTPLHCAASCNNVAMVRFLVEHGACILATTLSDHETAAEKCEQDEEGYDGCSQYLYSVQEKLGIMNGGLVYSVYDYEAQASDELDMGYNDSITILRRGDEYEREWWWGRNNEKQGYVPRNLLGLYPRVKNPLRDS